MLGEVRVELVVERRARIGFADVIEAVGNDLLLRSRSGQNVGTCTCAVVVEVSANCFDTNRFRRMLTHELEQLRVRAHRAHEREAVSSLHLNSDQGKRRWALPMSIDRV